MPLIDLQTNLKSLRYGHDRPGGASSGQPFITTSPDGTNTRVNIGPNNILKLLGINSIPGIPNISSIINRRTTVGNIGNILLTDDTFIRGGVTGAAQASVNDTFRIAAFLSTLPKGPLFIAKQVGLQLCNPRLEVRKGIGGVFRDVFQGLLRFSPARAGNVLGTLTGGLLEPTRVYNLGINTLAQVPVNAFGGHIVRHGLLPLQSDETKYESIVGFNNRNNNNRLQSLLGELQMQSFSRPIIKTIKVPTTPLSVANPSAASGGGFFYKNTQTGQLIPSSQLNFNDPAIQKLYQSNILIPAGSQQTLSPVTVQSAFANRRIIVKSGTVKPTISSGERIPSLSYFGGPKSYFGIGFTFNRRYSVTTYDTNEKLFKDISKQTTQNLTRLDVSGSDNEKAAVIADLGVSILDSRLTQFVDPTLKSYYPNNASQIRDFNVIPYTSNVPSLREYKTLVAQNDIEHIPKYISGSRINGRNGTNIRGGTAVALPSSSYTYYNTYGQTVKIVGSNNWQDISREYRTGDMGPSVAKYIDWTSGKRVLKAKKVTKADSINLTPIFLNQNSYWSNDGVTVDGVTYNIRDLAKFKIQSVLTNSPDESNFMIFRALLTDLSDSVDATWNDINYVGRGTPFYIYGGSTRKITIGFKVAALSNEEMAPMYSKLNYLMSNLMPDYDNKIMRGQLHRMTVGNYLDAQLGIITSLSYTIPNDSPWEIALDEPEGGKSQLILPHILDVSMTFIPIGAETQGTNKIEDKNRETTYIAQNNTGDADFIQYYDAFYEGKVQ